MAIRKFKPTTPGQRNKAISAFDEITTNKPQKSLLAPLKRTGGRNNTGQMTMRYIGGGHKKMYRIIDFLRNKDNVPAEVLTIEYDPNRSARIALVQYEDGEKRYILALSGRCCPGWDRRHRSGIFGFSGACHSPKRSAPSFPGTAAPGCIPPGILPRLPDRQGSDPPWFWGPGAGED